MTGNLLRSSTICLVIAGVCARSAAARAISIDERIEARRAVEQVYWRHRIWPSDNPGPKPEFRAAVPEAAIRAKVDDALAYEIALQQRWQCSIRPDEVQAELNRIAAESKDPAVLAELFAALHDDPALIAETLVRPLIAERGIRDQYARDRWIHADVRRVAERALVESGSTETLQESVDAFFTSTASWPKRPFDAWWQAQRARYAGAAVLDSADAYVLPAISAPGCSHDSWAPLSRYVPTQRGGHTAVWTGSEMIVWGGDSTPGGRYNPTTDTWQRTSLLNAPTGRQAHTVIWTGSEMIVWGGNSANVLGDGGRYNPATDQWASVSMANAPTPRNDHSAVWTGSEMIVWGGDNCVSSCSTHFDFGARYNPTNDTWTAMADTGIPSGRSGHIAVWTGSRMIVWGAAGDSSGGLYDPATNTWTAMTLANAPADDQWKAGVWTGTLLLVWGGTATTGPTGGRYDPTANVWSGMNASGAPVGRRSHTAVWTGSQLLVWGGLDRNDSPLSSGGRYSPSTDSWTAVSTVGAPIARSSHSAVWTGSRMVVWGGTGLTTPGTYFSGGRYDPVSDSWTPTATNAPAPRAARNATAIWTGAEMVVWGGLSVDDIPNQPLSTGGRYNPALDSWTPTPAGGAAPSPRWLHTAVWTGDRMIVWGGEAASVVMNTGATYDPAANTWATVPTFNAPEARSTHTAVWDGSRMIVWGGFRYTAPNQLSTGGRYDVATDTWSPTSAGPSGRSYHTAVWDGSRMIVWGGRIQNPSPGSPPLVTCTGSRYDPVADSWNPTSGVLTPCDLHTAVWTGSEMIIWGGTDANHVASPIGARYNPATNTFTPTSATNAPNERWYHTATWIAGKMAIWGGAGQDNGALYTPATDTWTPINRTGAVPPWQEFHAAAGTGTELLTWGGYSVPGTGGMYCFCGGSDTTCNGVDDDCDGPADEDFVPSATACGTGACASTGMLTCSGGATHDSCVPGAPAAEACNGVVDDVAQPFIAGLAFSTSGNNLRLGWSTVASASDYDVVQGDLGLLRSTHGNYFAATQACTASNVSAPPVTVNANPGPGVGIWYLVRGIACGGSGTYDDGSASQSGSRDSEILISGHDCP